MIINYKEQVPEADKYYQLFETAGWNEDYRADAEELYECLSNSWYTLAAYGPSQKLIGFGRVVSDGVLYALICDLIVHPDYQSLGIGSEIISRLIKKCRSERIRVVWLFAAKEKSEFYRKFGFKERPANAPGMQLKED